MFVAIGLSGYRPLQTKNSSNIVFKKISSRALGKCERNARKGKFDVKPLYLYRLPVEVLNRDSKRQLLYCVLLYQSVLLTD